MSETRKLLEEARVTLRAFDPLERNSIFARIDALLKTGGWISVEERLPEIDGTYQTVQKIAGDKHFSRAFRDFEKGKWTDPFFDLLGGELASTPIYWDYLQPLPYLPESSHD